MVVSDRSFPWGYPPGEKAPLMEKYLERDRPHVPILPTSHNDREKSALATQAMENPVKKTRRATSKTPHENVRTAQ